MCVSSKPSAVGTWQYGVLSRSPVSGAGEVSGSVEASGSSAGEGELEGSSAGEGDTEGLSAGEGDASEGVVASGMGASVSGTEEISPGGRGVVFVPQPASVMHNARRLHNKYEIRKNGKLFFFIVIL